MSAFPNSTSFGWWPGDSTKTVSTYNLPHLAYLDSTASVDEWIDEWTAAYADPTNDVSPTSNPDIDLARYGSQRDNSTLYIYADVTGKTLTGTPVPQPPQAAPPPTS